MAMSIKHPDIVTRCFLKLRFNGAPASVSRRVMKLLHGLGNAPRMRPNISAMVRRRYASIRPIQGDIKQRRVNTPGH